MISAERASEIAENYYDDVYHLCLSRLRKSEDAADVTQDVFLLFQEKYSDLEDCDIKSWLFSVADKKIKEQFRRVAKREKELIFGVCENLRTDMDIFYDMVENEKIADEELEKKKNIILDSLTEKELELFEMVYIKHLEYKELSKSFNISEAAIRTRICRLKLKIKEKASYIFMALLLLIMKL